MTSERDSKSTITKAWEYYQAGRDYNMRLTPNQYDLCNTNIEFMAGNQWLHLPKTAAMASLPKPVFNIIKRVTNVQIASLMSGGISVSLEPLSYYDGSSAEDPDSNACAFAQAEINNLFDKFKLEYRAREALFDGAQTGDYCAHFYFDPTALPYGGRLGSHVKGELRMELVDGINVMFGNPNSRDVQSQPYILLIGRDTCDNLNEEMRCHHKGEILEEIRPDNDTENQSAIGGKTEINTSLGHGKATYAYLYTKASKKVAMKDRNGNPVMEVVTDKNGEPVYEKDKEGKPILDSFGMPVAKLRQRYEYKTTVRVSKCTRHHEIFMDIDTEMTMYPIAWGNWEKQKNQYHGRALVTGIIQNQIFINNFFALVMRHMQLQAFPKRLYNADLISRFSNEIGENIGVRNLQPGQPINQVATTLQGMDLSNQILYVIDKAIEYTKDCLGSTDAQMGTSSMDNTSALMLLDTNSRTPLENIKAGLYEWVEDIVAIVLDMMATYYGKRPIVRERTFEEPVIDPATGVPMMDQYSGQMQMKSVTRRVIEEYDFAELKHLYFSSKVDVGSGNVYSLAAQLQTLDGLRREGVIEIVDYLERIPDSILPRRQELIQKLKTAAAQMHGGVPAGQALPMEGAGGATNSQMHSVLQQINPDKMAKQRGAGFGAPTAQEAIDALPINVKEQFDALPARAKGEVAKIAASRIDKGSK